MASKCFKIRINQLILLQHKNVDLKSADKTREIFVNATSYKTKLINSNLPFFFFTFFYDNVIAIRCKCEYNKICINPYLNLNKTKRSNLTRPDRRNHEKAIWKFNCPQKQYSVAQNTLIKAYSERHSS